MFVVFCPATSGGDPSAVLFERESLPWDFEAGHEAGQGVACGLGEGTAYAGICAELAPSLTSSGRGVSRPGESVAVAPTLDASFGRLQGCSGQDANHGHGHLIHAPSIARCDATREGSSQDFETTTMIAHTLRGEGFDASEDGTGRGTPLVPVTIPILEAGARTGKSTTDQRAGMGVGDDGDPMFTLQASKQHAVYSVTTANDHGADAGSLAPTLRAGGHKSSHANNGIAPAVAFSENVRGEVRESATSPALTSGGGKPGQGYSAAMTQSGVRRLTPTECERLQGFPDGHTDIRWKGKPAPDGPRYKSLGNSMAVTVMAWIGQRIDAFENGTLAGWRFDWSLLPWIGNYGTQQSAIAFALRGRDDGAVPEIEGDITGALRAAGGGSSRSYLATEAAE